MAAEFNNKPVAYIAGALNASACDYLKNVHKMIMWAEKIRKLGYAVFVPAEDLLRAITIGDLSYNDAFENSQPFLYLSDIVFVVPGWQSSEGTKRELESAAALGIPIFYSESGYTQLITQRLPEAKTADEIKEFHSQTDCSRYDRGPLNPENNLCDYEEQQKEAADRDNVPNMVDQIVSDSATLTLNKPTVRFLLSRYVQKLKNLKPQTVSGLNTINELLSALKRMGVDI